MDPDARLERRRLRRGDPEAFTALYRAHVDRVHRLAASLCGDGSLAEDVTAETFLAAWKNREAIADNDEALLPWLLAIAARQSLNATRGRRRQRSFLVRQGHRLVGTTADIADGVSARVDDTERLDRTRAALAHLGSREIEVLTLCVWSGLTTREAALALGLPLGTVRSRLSRARARLRALSEAPAHPPARPQPHPSTSSPTR